MLGKNHPPKKQIKKLLEILLTNPHIIKNRINKKKKKRKI